MSAAPSLPDGWSFGTTGRGDGPRVLDRRLQDGPGGCRVVAERDGDGWRFVAWGPDRTVGWSYRDWAAGRCEHWSGSAPQEHYARGEQVPQPAARLGWFTTAADARACCEGWLAGGGGDGD